MTKTKKLFVLLVMTALLAASVLGLAACGGGKATITLYDGDNVYKTEEVSVDSQYDLPALTKDGFLFLGWGASATDTSPQNGKITVSKDITLYAVWQKKTYFTVIFKGKDGEVIKTQDVLKGEDATAPVPPQVEGYTFSRWNADFTNVQSRLEVKAVYAINSYDITFVSFGGQVGTIEKEYKSQIAEADLPDLQKYGLEIVGWYTSDDFAEETKVDFAKFTVPANDAVLYAKWRAVKVDGISFTQGGEKTYGGQLTVKANHDKIDGIDYTYAWYLDDVLIDGQTADTLTYTAKKAGQHNFKVEVVAKADGAEASEVFAAYEVVDVAKRSLTVAADNQTITYGDALPSLTFDISGFASFDDKATVKNAIELACGYNRGGNVGKYDISASIGGEYAKNYNLTVSGQLTVNKKSITVKGNADKIFDGVALNMTLDTDGVIDLDTFVGSATSKSVNCGAFGTADDFDIVLLITNGNADKLGNYDIEYVFDGAITPAQITVNMPADSRFTYNGKEQTIPSASAEGVAGVDVKTTYTVADGKTVVDAGEYVVNVKFEAENHESVEKSFNIVVNKRDITVDYRYNKQFKDGGQPWSNSDWTNTINLKQYLAEGHTFAGTLSTDGSAIGVYTANGAIGDFVWEDGYKITDAQGADVSANYNLQYNLSVRIANAVEVSIADKTVVYDGQNHILEVDIKTEGATVKYTCDGKTYDQMPSFKNAGVYEIHWSATHPDYASSQGAVVLTVEKATLTFTVDDAVLTYGDSFDAANFVKANGIADGDDTPSFAITSDWQQKAGVYTTTVAGGETANYVWAEQSAQNITVNKKDLTITVDDATATYGDNAKLTYTVEGLVNGDADTVDIICDYAQGGNIGEYAVSASYAGANAGNYNVSVNDGTLTVVQRTVQVSLDETKYYDGKNEIGKSISGGFADDALSVVWTSESANAGVYTVGAQNNLLNHQISATRDGVDVSGNYDFVVSGTLTINQAEIEIKDGQAFSFMLNHSGDYTAKAGDFNLVNGGVADDVLTVLLDRTIATNVGNTFLTTASLAQNANYVCLNNNAEVAIKITSVLYSGDNLYYTIEDALEKTEGQITVVGDTAFSAEAVGYYGKNGSYTLNKDVKLLLACADNNTDFNYQNAIFGQGHQTNPTGYLTLTMPQNAGITLDIYGQMLVSSKRFGGAPVGGGVYQSEYAVFDIGDNNVIVQNGGVLYSMGFAQGDGLIDVKSGGKAYDAFTMTGFKGGQISYKIYRNVFPLNQYTISNIQCTLKINSGAELWASAIAGVNNGTIPSDVQVIGSGTEAMLSFESGDGAIIKRYGESFNGASNVKDIFETDGNLNLKLNNIAIKIKYILTITLSSKGLEIPFPGNFKFIFNDGASVTVDNVGVKLLPGAEMTVKQGAELNLINGARLFVYDDVSVWKDGNNGHTYPHTGYNAILRDKSLYAAMQVDFAKPAKLLVEGLLKIDGCDKIGGRIEAADSAVIEITSAGGEDGILDFAIKEDNTVYGGSAQYFYATAVFKGGINGDTATAVEFKNNFKYTVVNGEWVATPVEKVPVEEQPAA